MKYKEFNKIKSINEIINVLSVKEMNELKGGNVNAISCLFGGCKLSCKEGCSGGGKNGQQKK